MSGRLDPRPLFDGLANGLRNRRPTGSEPADWPTRTVLFAPPVIGAAMIVLFQKTLQHGDQLLAGLALLVGALLTAFTQIAAWRQRYSGAETASTRRRRRSLDEAAAHILVSVLAVLLASGAMVALTNIDFEHGVGRAKRIAGPLLSGLGVGCFIYIFVSLVIVVNLLWDAYTED